MDTRPFLILGPTGGFGGALLTSLHEAGMTVRAFARDTRRGRGEYGAPVGIEWIAGDTNDADAVQRAAQGVQAIVHGINCPAHLWPTRLARATDNVVAAAEASGAAIICPGSLHVYARGLAGHPINEDAPQQPDTDLGRTRLAIERRVLAAQGARVLLIRSASLFGPPIGNRRLDMIFGAAKSGQGMSVPGTSQVRQQWTYLPDLARATVALYQHRDLAAGAQVVHYPGFGFDNAVSFANAVAAIAAGQLPPCRALPWWRLVLQGVVDADVRALVAERATIDAGLELDGARFRRLLPGFAPTPLAQALAVSLDKYRQRRDRFPDHGVR